MNVRLKYDMPFVAGIYHDDKLIMNTYNLRLWMTTNSENTADQAISFERIKYFIYSQIENTIFIDNAEQDQCTLFTMAGLDITTTPGDPVDQLIGLMLYYKLNAITEERMIIVETELSSIYGNNMTYLHGEFENTSGYEQPDWWTSPDLTHSDFIPPEDSEKVLSIPQTSSWRNLELGWPDEPVSSEVSGNIVVFADFKQPNATE
jgi:hypothetical protein